MPNGGSDCCGTCWFNRSNEGVHGYPDRWDDLVPPHCEIRDEPIENPFWTYCANHPHRRSERDPIPIGPILVPGGQAPDGRVVKNPSPDTEEIRQHLLRLLAELHMVAAADAYPTFLRVTDMVIWQLGEFREQRAVEILQQLNDEVSATAAARAQSTHPWVEILPRLDNEVSKGSATVVQQALRRIIEGTEQDFPLASLSDALATESQSPVSPHRRPVDDNHGSAAGAAAETGNNDAILSRRRRQAWISRWRRRSR